MAHDAVVYDLDGTLVRLRVDWPDLEREIGDLLAAEGVDPDDYDTWELLDAADEAGIGEEVEALVSTRERAGAERSHRLPLADELAGTDRPAAVCSLNCEAACRIALERHGLLEHVQAVVGRDTVSRRKPDPEPLLAAVRALDADPERVLFVGDSDSDRVTAERAGTAFRFVDPEEPADD